ncbi:MAG: MFS transporter [Enterobacteriaceae bacterium]
MTDHSLHKDQARPGTAYGILGGISFSHLLNDMTQSLILAIYPILQGDFNLSFIQIGMITLIYQLSASLLQPVIGYYTDRNPKPYSLPIGMGFTLSGLLLLAFAGNFITVICAAALVGTGSSVFHPESSRVARMASGGQHGLAQSIFQVGGNLGSAMGPLLAALLIAPYGKSYLSWFSLAPLLAIIVLLQISRWYQQQNTLIRAHNGNRPVPRPPAPLPRKELYKVLTILLLLIFSKQVYIASLSSYYTFYLIDKFAVSVQTAQLYLFLFLFAAALGTLVGGPIGDRIGRKYVIWISILGIAPFTLMLPYVSLFWTACLSVVIGLILSSAFSAILVYAQELMPGRVGTVAGLFFGFSFGMGGLGAAVLGVIADISSIRVVYQICAWLPLIGLIAFFLPTESRIRNKK